MGTPNLDYNRPALGDKPYRQPFRKIQAFLLEAIGECEACGYVPPPGSRGYQESLNLHHIWGTHILPENLILLCADCHFGRAHPFLDCLTIEDRDEKLARYGFAGEGLSPTFLRGIAMERSEAVRRAIAVDPGGYPGEVIRGSTAVDRLSDRG